jgi:hypothetical protein
VTGITSNSVEYKGKQTSLSHTVTNVHSDNKWVEYKGKQTSLSPFKPAHVGKKTSHPVAGNNNNCVEYKGKQTSLSHTNITAQLSKHTTHSMKDHKTLKPKGSGSKSLPHNKGESNEESKDNLVCVDGRDSGGGTSHPEKDTGKAPDVHNGSLMMRHIDEGDDTKDR